jgi:hypothetical protein
LSNRIRGHAKGDDAPRPEDLARAVERCEAARARSLAYAGKSEHMRRKLDAAVRSAENDVAILRYAIREKGQAAGTDRAAGGG